MAAAAALWQRKEGGEGEGDPKKATAARADNLVDDVASAHVGTAPVSRKRRHAEVGCSCCCCSYAVLYASASIQSTVEWKPAPKSLEPLPFFLLWQCKPGARYHTLLYVHSLTYRTKHGRGGILPAGRSPSVGASASLLPSGARA